MTLEQLKKRFGEIAAEKGFITHGQLDEALDVQRENALKGLAHRLIGSVLYRGGFMTIEQVIEVLAVLEAKSD
jgi:hypothetical protein